jgi:hypothetical protein
MLKIMTLMFLSVVYQISDINAQDAESMGRSIALGKISNFKPVGFVRVVGKVAGAVESHGSATHIGDGILITAAHTLSDLFPKDVPLSGPVVIDVRDRTVIWANSQIPEDIDVDKVYRAVSVVVDARFIHEYRASGGEVSGQITRPALKYDVAFIKLEEVPNTGSIPLVEHLTKLPDFGVLVGYGISSFMVKHAFMQTIGLRGPLLKGRELISDVYRFNIGEYISLKPRREHSCDIILGRQCNERDYITFEGSPGDSGGPLLVEVDGAMKIVGIMSYIALEHPQGQEYLYPDGEHHQDGSIDDPITGIFINGYSSLISGKPNSFSLNKDIRALLNATRGHEVQVQPTQPNAPRSLGITNK